MIGARAVRRGKSPSLVSNAWRKALVSIVFFLLFSQDDTSTPIPGLARSSVVDLHSMVAWSSS
jgi:hypothetical protein